MFSNKYLKFPLLTEFIKCIFANICGESYYLYVCLAQIEPYQSKIN